MASVTVNMRLCDKRTKVSVTPNDDGTYDVRIDTNCDHVNEYAKGMQNITVDDIIDMSKSRVVSYESTLMMTPTCLVPKAVLYAAWLEMGMISPTRAKDAGENSISFE